ncbi:MAG TPA: hypothetical protein VFE23_13045 [Usitatibacter sp.]|jgi:hypothetical protein|nr:hypothetical protein [Usitatibacter sp.]
MVRVLLALALLAAGAAAAAEPRYAVLSLLSDRLTIVTRDMATGSHIDRNHHDFLAVPGNLLDRNMVLALDDALHAAGAQGRTVLLFSGDPAIFARQAQGLDAGAGTAALLDAVRPVLRGVDATHLVLATKYRHDARLQVEDGYVGSGMLEGLGFYVDRTYEPRRIGTIGVAPGYLAAYTYYKLSLVELASGRVVREVPVFASETRLGSAAVSGHPWDAMSSADKVAALDRLLRAETPQATARLLAP